MTDITAGMSPQACAASVDITETDRQKLFDVMLGHVRKQGQPSVRVRGGTSKCLYRTDGGLKCAVGALIPYDRYSEEFEDTGTYDVLNRLGIYDADLIEFFTTAQSSLHDSPNYEAKYPASRSFLDLVEEGARSFAIRYDLVYTAPEEITA